MNDMLNNIICDTPCFQGVSLLPTTELRSGITTGSCATAAAKAAVLAWQGTVAFVVAIDTPTGKQLSIPVIDAATLPEGGRATVIKDAGDLNIAGIAKAINDKAARVRDNSIAPDELSGSTFTITNTGSAGALFDTPIINQPEVAILGIGTIVKRPAVIKDADGNEVIGLRSMVYLALSYDHRLVDGADAGRYLSDLKRRLESGDFEGDLGI